MQRQPEQCGAVFIVAGRLLGLDAVSSPAAWATLHDKLVRSYAVDSRIQKPDPQGAPGDHLDPLAAVLRLFADIGEVHWNVHPAVGLGQDLRTRSPQLDAGALIVEDEVVHLVAFPKKAGERREDRAPSHRAPMPQRRSF